MVLFFPPFKDPHSSGMRCEDQFLKGETYRLCFCEIVNRRGYHIFRSKRVFTHLLGCRMSFWPILSFCCCNKIPVLSHTITIVTWSEITNNVFHFAKSLTAKTIMMTTVMTTTTSMTTYGPLKLPQAKIHYEASPIWIQLTLKLVLTSMAETCSCAQNVYLEILFPANIKLTMGKLNSGHFMFYATAFFRRDEISKSIWPLERSLNFL